MCGPTLDTFTRRWRRIAKFLYKTATLWSGDLTSCKVLAHGERDIQKRDFKSAYTLNLVTPAAMDFFTVVSLYRGPESEPSRCDRDENCDAGVAAPEGDHGLTGDEGHGQQMGASTGQT